MSNADATPDPTVELVDDVLRYSRDVVVIADAGGAIVYASPSITTVLGYARSDLVGQGLDVLFDPDASVLHRLESWLEHGDAGLDGETNVVNQAGEWLQVQAFFQPLSANSTGALAATIRSNESDGSHEASLRRQLMVEGFCNELSAKLMMTTTSGELFDQIQLSCEQIGGMLGSHSVSLYLERPEEDALKRLGHWFDPRTAETESSGTLPLSKFPDLSESLLTRQYVANDISRTPYASVRSLTDGSNLSAFLSVPFISGNRRGLLSLGRRGQPHQWHLVDAQLVRAASRIFAMALHRSQVEQLWNLTYHHGPIGFSIRTRAGKLVECNQQYLDLFGLSTEQEDASDVFARIHEDDLDHLRMTLKSLLEPDRANVALDVRAHHANGSVINLHLHVSEIVVPGQADPLRLTAVQESSD